jgi:hypothetical protein
MADEYEWAETHGDGAENRTPAGDGWEYVTQTGAGPRRVTRWRRKRGNEEKLRVGVGALIEKWIGELREYPASIEGRYAAAAVAGCVKELRALLKRAP